MSENEENLVRVAQQGARPEADQAFAALVLRYEGPLRKVLRAYTHNSHDTEDLAEEVFIRAWTHLPRLKNPGFFARWLFQTARNLGVDFGRSRKMKPLPGLSAPEIMETFPMAAGDPCLPEMRRAIASLPPKTLHLLYLKYADGLDYEEIAEAEGVSVSTVRDRLITARESMEVVMQRGGFLEPYARALEEKRRRRAARSSPPPGPSASPPPGAPPGGPSPFSPPGGLPLA